MSYRRQRFKQAVPYLLIFLSGIIFIGFVVFISNLKPNYIYKEAIYKGYLRNGYRYTYPIVEIDGKEIKSTNSQMIRDDSYVGNTVIIAYIGDNIERFIVQW